MQILLMDFSNYKNKIQKKLAEDKGQSSLKCSKREFYNWFVKGGGYVCIENSIGRKSHW